MSVWPVSGIGITALNGALFMPTAGLTVTITSPAAGGTVTGLPWAVVWNFSPGTQADYDLVVYANDGVTVLYDSGIVASAVQGANIPITVPLVNGVAYKIKVTIHTTIGQPGASALQSFTASWTPPATIAGLTLTKHGEQS